MGKIKHTLVAAAAIAGAVALAPTANADNAAYLNLLEGHGIYVYNPGMALSTGYQLCGAMDSGHHPAAVAESFYMHTSYADVPTQHVANTWTAVAIVALCPWNSLSDGQVVA